MKLVSPATKGASLALFAAVLFGISTPLVQRAGTGLGPFTTAALLYGGAALIGALLRQPVDKEAGLRRTDIPRLALMAFFGALLGPVALAWGLQHTSGASASLMLALEALFTVLLARALYREFMDRRVWTAILLLFAGGLILVLDRGFNGKAQLLGLLAVLAATVAWSIDNTLSRALAERDPGQVILWKSVMGVTAATALAAVADEKPPAFWAGAAMLGIGATGYGLSLRLYLLAQRAFGAARTGSMFAFAPFIGALLATALGEQAPSWAIGVGGLLMLAGVALHLAESHDHSHQHEAIDHEHAHTHDDVHHQHDHELNVGEAHSHRHHHAPSRHSHPHMPDAHHLHRH